MARNLTIVTLLILGGLQSLWAQDIVCAVVRMEILQEVTFARQGFEGRMKITNGTSETLEELSVALEVTDALGGIAGVTLDSDADADDFKFFATRTEPEGTDIPPLAAGASLDIVFLFIPTLSAVPDGSEQSDYRIGASLSYRVDGADPAVPATVVEVIPDTVTVKALPEITLDYFLPGSVFADDPLTPIVETPVPFQLGLRVFNRGGGFARNLAIASAQPRIVANDQGLLIDFRILSSSVGIQPAAATLKAVVGDLPLNSGIPVQWEMITSLSGEFLSMSATIAHADELGGQLTSLVQDPTTNIYLLAPVSDVSRGSGADALPDFLGFPWTETDTFDSESSPRLFTSTDEDAFSVQNIGTHASVSENREFVEFEGLDDDDDLTAEGRVFLDIPDPNSGTRTLAGVVRSDGKVLREDHFRLGRYYLEPGSPDVQAERIYLFDSDFEAGDSYKLVWGGSPASANQPPVVRGPTALVMAIPSADDPVSIVYSATDADGPNTPPTVNALLLDFPGIRFESSGDGIGSLVIDSSARTGTYNGQIVASDGKASSLLPVSLTLTQFDSLLSDWMDLHGISDVFADEDGDGVANFIEFALNLDPQIPDLSGMPPVRVVDHNANKVLEMTVRLLPGLKGTSEWTFEVLASTDPTFTEIELIRTYGEEDFVDNPGQADGLESFQVLDSDFPLVGQAAKNRFLKLKVTYDPPNS